MTDLNELRTRLEADLKDVLSKHARISAHLRNTDRELPADWSDMAQFVENDEVLEVLEERTRDRIEHLIRALRRIENGTYTCCASCGGEILAERLELLPTTIVCARCAGIDAEAQAAAETPG